MLDSFVQIGGTRFSGDEDYQKLGLQFSIEEVFYHGGEAFEITLRNSGDETLIIERAGFCFHTAKSRSKRDWRVFLDQGGCGWCGVKRLASLDPDPRMQPIQEQRISDDQPEPLPFHRSDLQAVVWDAVSKEAKLVGFLRQRFGPNKVDVIPTEDVRDIRRIEAWQEFYLELAPGETLTFDTLITASDDDPYRLLEEFGEAVRNHQDRVFDQPPIVGMMSWYGYRTAITEEIILENSKIIGDLFDGYPQQMKKLMLLDHGWNEDANWGYWEHDKARFPHGMKWLANRLSECNLEMGLWYTPFCISWNAPNKNELAPLQSLDAEGKPFSFDACVWGDLPGHSRGLHRTTFFDGGLDAVQEKWQHEFAQMRDYGTKYWKIDFFALGTSEANKKNLGLGELWNRTWTNWRDVLGHDAHLAPCSCATNLQIGYNDSVRIGSDIGNAGHWPGAWEDYRYGLATICDLWYKNRKFWVNDPDSFQIAKGCGLNEARVRATAVALSGGHFMLSEDLRMVDAERLAMVKRLIPPYPEAAKPLDMFEDPFPEGYPKLWSLKLETSFGPMTVLAVFNLTGKTREYEITPEMLGIEPKQEFIALEWWQCRWLGRFSDKFTIEVPAEDVVIIHAQPASDMPSVVSCSHHITGGYIIESVDFDESTGRLSGVVATRAGTPVVLFGQIPEGWQLSREAQFHSTVSSVGGWQSEVVTTGMWTPFEIVFERVVQTSG